MKSKTVLILIFFLSLFLVFFKIGSVPPGINWDEAAIGWNAKTIFHTRRDEYGTRLPLTFKSFGDYKAPLYIYLTAPIVGIFGMNEVSVRLLSALAGLLSVLVLYFLVKELILKNNHISHITYHISLLSALLLIISPWHIMMSRFASEQSLANFFILLAVLAFFLSFKKRVWLIISAISFAFSFYTYHSPKIFVPFLLVGLFLIFRKKLTAKKMIFWSIAALTAGLLLLLPLGKSLISSEGQTRFSQTSIFYTKEGGKQPLNFNLIEKFAENYLSHYSPKFLFLGSDKNPRVQMKKVGPLLLIEAPFLLWGLFALVKQRREKWAKFLLWWLLVGPIAAAIGFEAPHLIRAFHLLPALTIIAALGVLGFLRFLKNFKKSLRIALVYSVIVFFFINIFYFAYRYFIFYSIYSAPDWQYGHKQIARITREYEDKVEKIIMTSYYGQPHIFMLFYQKRDPQQVFWGAMSKYLYRVINWDEDPHLENVLLIGTPEEIPGNAKRKVAEINFPDGSIAFRIVKTD